jgi:hypothetical protein
VKTLRLKKPQNLKYFAKKVKPFIHIPTMDGRVECGLLQAVACWAKWLPMSINQSMHMVPLDYARNHAINDFLDAKDCTHFLGIDEDIIPFPGTLEAMLTADVDAIAPLIYPIVCERRNGGMKPKMFSSKELVEVDLIPGGMYLLKRRVVEKLRKPVFKYKYDRRGYLKGGTDRYLSDGIKKAGFKMHVHPVVRCEQTVIIGANSFNDTMNRYCTRRS